MENGRQHLLWMNDKWQCSGDIMGTAEHSVSRLGLPRHESPGRGKGNECALNAGRNQRPDLYQSILALHHVVVRICQPLDFLPQAIGLCYPHNGSPLFMHFGLIQCHQLLHTAQAMLSQQRQTRVHRQQSGRIREKQETGKRSRAEICTVTSSETSSHTSVVL